MAAECHSRRDVVVGRRHDEVWDAGGDQKVEVGQPQEIGIGSILEEMSEMMKTTKGENMLSVSVPKAMMPQFKLSTKLSQLKEQGVEVAKLLADDLESTIHSEDFVEQRMQRAE